MRSMTSRMETNEATERSRSSEWSALANRLRSRIGGVVCDVLREAAEDHALTYARSGHAQPPHARRNDRRQFLRAHSVMSGKTEENIEALEALTDDGARFRVGPTSEEELDRTIRAGGRNGEIYAGRMALCDKYADEVRAPLSRHQAARLGYNLNQLLPENGFNVARALVGSEGTCALTLHERANLVHSLPGRVGLVLHYPDIYCK